MKNLNFYFLLVILSSTLFYNNVFAQRNIGGTPYSFSEKYQQEFSGHFLSPIILNAPNKQALKDRDEQKGITNGYSEHIPVNFTLNNSGKWINLPNGDRLWQLKIVAPDADGILLTYEAFQLPDEGLLYIYNEDKTEVIGGFSSFNNRDGADFSTAPIHGETTILEYYEPKEVRDEAIIHIDNVSFIYNGAIGYSIANPQQGDPEELGCHVSVNCPEGDDWQDEKKGVVKVIIVFENSNGPGGTAKCTGSLINNTALDKTPYVLSAAHCVLWLEYTNGITLKPGSYQFVFNYETYCNTNNAPQLPSVETGCVRRSGWLQTDYVLWELNDNVPTTLNPFFNGWDRTDNLPQTGVTIHHPDGVTKKISIDNDPINLAQDFSHYYGPFDTVYFKGIDFFSLDYDVGTIEGGSSGAPLFDQSGRIVGQASTAFGSCTYRQSRSGRLCRSWAPAPEHIYQLKHWLDPINSAAIRLNGLNGGPTPGCGNIIEWTGEADLLNASTWGSGFTFIKGEMSKNVVSLREAYFHNVDEVDEILTTDKEENQKVQAALRDLIFKGSKSFFRAFVFNMDNELSEKELNALSLFLEELYPLLRSEEIKTEVKKLYSGLHLSLGKDLKTGMKIYDQANISNLLLMPSEQTKLEEQFQLVHSLGETSILFYKTFEESQVQIDLIDMSGKPIRTILSEKVGAGNYQVDIQKSDLSDGVYLIRTQVINRSGMTKDVKRIVKM